MAHNLGRWTGRITRSARCPALHLLRGWPWKLQFSGVLARFRVLPFPSTRRLCRLTRLRTIQPPGRLAPGRAPCVSCRQLTAGLAPAGTADRQKSPSIDCRTRQQVISAGLEPGNLVPSLLTSGLTLSAHPQSSPLRWIGAYPHIPHDRSKKSSLTLAAYTFGLDVLRPWSKVL